ncbi:MAG TPA: RagB/SusD family nutrient uptake outer membrane protein, partial [Mariniflexile sp.]
MKDPGSPTQATFFETEAQLEVALAGVYASLVFNTSNSVPFTQILDHITDYSFLRGEVSAAKTATLGGLTPTSNLSNDYWNKFYTGIQRANNLLSGMEKARDVTSESRFEGIRAEALFLRAIFYSYLIELYGDVPFRAEISTTLNDLALPRTPKAEI